MRWTAVAFLSSVLAGCLGEVEIVPPDGPSETDASSGDGLTEGDQVEGTTGAGQTGGLDATGNDTSGGDADTGSDGGTDDESDADSSTGGEASTGGETEDSSTGSSTGATAICGNLEVEVGEACDDGNTDPDDGCAADCSEANCLVPASHPDIQSALDDLACPTVWVMPDTYVENVVVARDVAVVAVAEGVVLDGGDSSRVVQIDSGEVELHALTITHGRSNVGGGVMSFGALTLNGCVVTDNVATGPNSIAGAGVFSSGSAALNNTVVSDNRLEIQPGGEAPFGLGAGIFASGDFAMSDGSEVFGNTTDDGQINATMIGIGVALQNAVATIEDSSIHDNSATATGDAMPQVLQGGGLAAFSSQVVISGSTFEHNALADSVDGNAGLFGAGLYLSNSAVDLLEVTVDGNQAVADGIEATARGGGLYVDGSPVSLSIRRSTISNNAVLGENTAGGGLHVSGAEGTLSLVNATVSGNDSTGPTFSAGGGMLIAQGDGLSVGVNNVTVTDNSAGPGSGGGIAFTGVLGPNVNLRNSIVAGNVAADAPDCDSAAGFPPGTPGYNIFGTDNACFFSLFGIDIVADPLLGPLADNGGFTLTHALDPASPAIDAGNPEGCTDGIALVDVDQRGEPRLQPCDIGAFELQP